MFHTRYTCCLGGPTIRTVIIGELCHCYALASADGTTYRSHRMGRGTRQNGVPIDPLRMEVLSATRDILSILHPT
jgi:hypothetical protein